MSYLSGHECIMYIVNTLNMTVDQKYVFSNLLTLYTKRAHAVLWSTWCTCPWRRVSHLLRLYSNSSLAVLEVCPASGYPRYWKSETKLMIPHCAGFMNNLMSGIQKQKTSFITGTHILIIIFQLFVPSALHFFILHSNCNIEPRIFTINNNRWKRNVYGLRTVFDGEGAAKSQ